MISNQPKKRHKYLLWVLLTRDLAGRCAGSRWRAIRAGDGQATLWLLTIREATTNGRYTLMYDQLCIYRPLCLF